MRNHWQTMKAPAKAGARGHPMFARNIVSALTVNTEWLLLFDPQPVLQFLND